MGTLQDALKKAKLATEEEIKKAEHAANREMAAKARQEAIERENQEYERLLAEVPPYFVEAFRLARKEEPSLFSLWNLKEFVYAQKDSVSLTQLLGRTAVHPDFLREPLLSMMSKIILYNIRLEFKK